MTKATKLCDNKPYITRFAPSPTGHLHLGHAYSALFAFQKAKENNGKFILRIEDIDRSRCKDEYAQDLLEDLEWLGIEWEKDVKFQSQHMEEYHKAINLLFEMGVLYRCFMSRKEMEQAALSAPHGFTEGIDGVKITTQISKDEEEARLKNNEKFSLRLNANAAMEKIGKDLYFEDERLGSIKIDPFLNGDVIIARKDNMASYHICAIYDDNTQNVNHIIRGDDLLTSTHIQFILAELLAYKHPKYLHHPILLDKNGYRFAKRDKSLSLRSMRQEGKKLSDIKNMINQNLQNAGFDKSLLLD